jgi:PTS system galactitol-specific IIB component
MEGTKPFVMVVCGAGTLTSVMAAQGIEDGLKKKGLKNYKIKVGRIDEVKTNESKIDVLVASMKVRNDYSFPVINAVSFLTGDEEGQQKVIDQVADIVQGLSS